MYLIRILLSLSLPLREPPRPQPLRLRRPWTTFNRFIEPLHPSERRLHLEDIKVSFFSVSVRRSSLRIRPQTPGDLPVLVGLLPLVDKTRWTQRSFFSNVMFGLGLEGMLGLGLGPEWMLILTIPDRLCRCPGKRRPSEAANHTT